MPNQQQSIVYVIGARPNFVKMAPVIAALKSVLPSWDHPVVHTGQHYDYSLSDVFVEQLGLEPPAFQLDVGSGSHGVQTARVLERIEPILVELAPAAVIVAGDVNSTLAAAIAAAKLEIPVAHVESGLRSFDRSMPEELNRLLVDQISDWCFTHSPEAAENLMAEGVPAERIHAVGNTMIDSLVRLLPSVREPSLLAERGLSASELVLVTLHRPALVDGELLDRTLEALAELARTIPVVFPVHPRTRERIPPRFAPPGLHLVAPLSYLEFLALERDARAVITDSGGVQEETSFFGTPCFTLRANTERPITIELGTNQLLGLRPEAVLSVPALLGDGSRPRVPPVIPGWDGRAASRIAEIVRRDLEVGAGTAEPVTVSVEPSHVVS